MASCRCALAPVAQPMSTASSTAARISFRRHRRQSRRGFGLAPRHPASEPSGAAGDLNELSGKLVCPLGLLHDLDSKPPLANVHGREPSVFGPLRINRTI